MEAEGLEQKVSWLDEQRRRDLSVLEGFQERLAQLEGQIQSQKEQAKNVVAEMSRLNTLAARIEEFDDSLHKHRQEVTRQLKAQSEAREERQKNLEEIRKSDHEAISARITELREQVQGLTGFEDDLNNRKQEEMRLSKAIDAIEKRVEDTATQSEDYVRRVSNVEEGQSAASQRITEAQTDINSLRQQLESLKGSNDLLEDRFRRIDTRLSELETTESEQSKTMEAWRENQSRKLVDFERQWTEWEERFASFEKMAADLDERMIQYEETYRNAKQLQSEIKKVVERLERRINEITEMQRLADDRQKQEWRDFVADDSKRWNTFKLTMEEQWREHTRQHVKIDDLLEATSEATSQSERRLDELQSGIDRRLRDLLDVARQWIQVEESSD